MSLGALQPAEALLAAVAATLLLAGAGALAVRTAPPLARLAAWLVATALAVGGLILPAARWDERPTRTAEVALRGEPAAARTGLLAAAAGVDARADALRARWERPQPFPGGPLAAAVVMPKALPFAPEELQLRVLGEAARDRPLALEVAALAVDAPLDGELRVVHGGVEVHRAAVVLGRTPATVTFVPLHDGAHALELTVRVDGHAVHAQGVVDVAPPPGVLVLEPGEVLTAALRAQGVHAQRAATLPAPAQLRDHAAFVVATPLTAAVQQALAAAVADGAGAFVVGPAFGAEREPMRALLPLRPAPQQPEPAANGGDAPGTGPTTPPRDAPPPDAPKPPPPPDDTPPAGPTGDTGKPSPEPIDVDKHAIAMVLVVDRSGSMAQPLADGQTKTAYARASARATARALDEGDHVGVVTFGVKDEGRIELPMTPATERRTIDERIARIGAGDNRTYLASGLERAYSMLVPVRAAVKHVVVISDGEWDPSEKLRTEKLAYEHLQRDGITLSVIAMTDTFSSSAFSRAALALSRQGGGEFLETDKPGQVPFLVSAELTRSLKRVNREPRAGDGDETAPQPPAKPPEPPVKPPEPAPPVEPPRPEEPKPPARVAVRAVADSALLVPLPAEWPSLARAIAGTAPLDAQVLLVAGDEGWPLLAFGNRGLGRVGAFAADLAGDEAADFRAEPSFPARLAQWVQSVLPPRPAANAAALLTAHRVEPPAPSPADVRAMAELATAPPQASLPAPVPTIVRSFAPSVPPLAPWLLLALVLLAVVERLAAARALRAS